MKNRLITLSFRKIKGSFKRFFSLVILSLLGISFFTGMRITMPAMLLSLDKYYKENKVYDVEILSTNGLNEKDVEELTKIDDNLEVHGLHFKDVLFNDKNTNTNVIRIKELDDSINKFVLLEGRLPEKENEIVIDEKYTLIKNAKLGDELELLLNEDDNELVVNKVKIVGFINSPIYLATNSGSLNRGNTMVGNGEIKYYAYALSDIFNIDYYTEIYIVDKTTNEYLTNSEEYNDEVEKVINKIDSIKEERIQYRYEELKAIALARIDAEEEKVLKELNDSKEKLLNIKNEIDNAGRELSTKKQELDTANNELKNKKKEITNAEKRISDGERELNSKKQELDNAKASIDKYDNVVIAAKHNRDSVLTKDDLISILPEDDEYESNVAKLNLAEGMNVDFSSTTIIKKQIIDANIDNNGSIIKKVEDIEKGFAAALELDNAYSLYYSKVNELNNYKSQIEGIKSTYNNYLNEYNSGLSLYNQAYEEYSTKLNEFNNAYNEIISAEEAAKVEFENARLKVDETITPGTWIIRNRLDNTDYSGYIDSIESLRNLSVIFPAVFFAVSIFISLLSMTRMAFEDRNEMGTLKAFGFSKKEILIPYITYASLANLIGSIVGIILGVFYFPGVLFNVYANLYDIPDLIFGDISLIIIVGFLISFICVVGASLFSIFVQLRFDAITLLRPIAPPIGKRVLVENLTFMWKKMTFQSKITVRNIFRYKRRIIMTMIGIASCSMILTASFLIRDSITSVLDIQFNELFTYDSIIYLDGKKLSYELDEIFKSPNIDKIAYMDQERVKVNKTQVNLIVPINNDGLDGIIKLRDKNGDLNINDDGVIITSKLADMNHIKIGDNIKFKTTGNMEYELKVSGIADNYIGHYIYMSKDSYQEKIGLHKINMALLKLDNSESETGVTRELLDNNKNILSYLSISNSVAGVQNMFSSLDKVVLIVVIFSFLLTVVVLYSLAYIVISEREREIATLKVLGFDNEEVDMYLLREQTIIVCTSILIGLIVGIFYSLMLVDTIEINMVQFNKNLMFRNFIVVLLLMISFSLVVGQLIHFRLTKIKMVESLKTIE